MTRKFSVFLVLAVIAAFMGYAAWKVLLAPSDLPPKGSPAAMAGSRPI